jgi:hypothetical protein
VIGVPNSQKMGRFDDKISGCFDTQELTAYNRQAISQAVRVGKMYF